MEIHHSKSWLLMTGTQGHCFLCAILQSIQVAFLINNAHMPQILLQDWTDWQGAPPGKGHHIL